MLSAEKKHEVLAVDTDKEKTEELKTLVIHAVHMDAAVKENL